MPAHLLLLRLARRRGAQQVSATVASTVEVSLTAATATAELTATAATAVAAAMVPYYSLLHPLNLPSRYRLLANPSLAFEP